MPEPTVADLRKLLAEATPGPLELFECVYTGPTARTPGFWTWELAVGDDVWLGGAATSDLQPRRKLDLIVAAVNALPGLLDRIEALEDLKHFLTAATLVAFSLSPPLSS